MIRLPEHRLVWCHIPKTGGSSVTAALAPFCSRPGPVPEDERPGWQAKFHEGGMHTGPNSPPNWRTATNIRNPWDRAASLWNFMRRGDERIVDFCDRIRRGGEGRLYYVRDQWTIAERCAFRLRFEQLAEDFAALCEALEIPAGPLPHRNDAGPRPAYEWTPEDCEAVRQTWPRDVHQLGYRGP